MNFESKLTFGKYRGKTIGYIYKVDSQYLYWAMEKTNNLKLSAKDRIKIIRKARIEKIIQFNWSYN